jgi:hypothetical protein
VKINYSFYLVVDHAIDKKESIFDSVSSLSDSNTTVHQEHINGISTFQIDTTDFSVAAKIKLIFGHLIHHEDSGDA